MRQVGLVQWNRMCVAWGQTHLGLVQAIVLTDGDSMPLILRHLASSIIMYVQSRAQSCEECICMAWIWFSGKDGIMPHTMHDF